MTTFAFIQEKDCAIDAARAAGAIIRSFYSTPYTVDYKDRSKDSPVTIADRDANQKIHEILQAAFPQYGWLSEETVDSPDRLSRQRVWLVDPLDGTKEFIDKIPEFGVSIALVENSLPVVAVVYNPIHDELFWAVRGHGTWHESATIASYADRATLCRYYPRQPLRNKTRGMEEFHLAVYYTSNRECRL